VYVPDHFKMSDELCLEMLRNSGAGSLVTAGGQGLQATTVPFSFNESAGPLGALRTHLARVNPQWRDEGEALVIFRGPDAFVGAWDFPGSGDRAGQPESFNFAGSWNYLEVQVHGVLSAHTDPEWNRAALLELSAKFEPSWPAERATEDWMAKQLRALVGVQVQITKIEGKAKLTQNKSPQTIAVIADALDRTGRSPLLARYMREISLPHATARYELLDSLRNR
jgi:transcriptional regulator